MMLTPNQTEPWYINMMLDNRRMEQIPVSELIIEEEKESVFLREYKLFDNNFKRTKFTCTFNKDGTDIVNLNEAFLRCKEIFFSNKSFSYIYFGLLTTAGMAYSHDLKMTHIKFEGLIDNDEN